MAQKDPKQSKVRIILTEIANTDASDDVGLFVLSLRCLIEHRINPELRDSEVAKLADLAKNLLAKARIKPKTSKLSYLYENLFLVLSQIDAENNRMWQAGWNQMLSSYFLDSDDAPASPKQQLAAAIRRFHLGFINSAMQNLDQLIQNSSADARDLAHAAILRLRLLHVGGKLAEFEEFLPIARQYSKASPEFLSEVEWEAVIKSAIHSRSLTEIIKEVKKGRPFYAPTYILEAQLVVLTLGTQSDRLKLENLSTIDNRRELSFRACTQLRDAVLCIHDCHDTEIPIHHRLINLGTLLAGIQDIKSVFHQMLIEAAAHRWLRRSRLDMFAEFCADDFASRGLRASEGQSRDPLNLLSVLTEENAGESE